MGARRFEELACWQLADALKKRVYALAERPAVKRDSDFCRQLKAAASSAPSNIAEGFGRFRPAEFAKFLQIAKGSLTETQNHLLDARDRRHLDDAEYEDLTQLTGRAISATAKLIRYLRSCSGANFDTVPRRER